MPQLKHCTLVAVHAASFSVAHTTPPMPFLKYYPHAMSAMPVEPIVLKLNAHRGPLYLACAPHNVGIDGEGQRWLHSSVVAVLRLLIDRHC